jgi:hypothetical protein
MIQAYNFLASWQLFPEKGIYQTGERPKSGFYKIESNEAKDAISISHNWVTLENNAFTAQYSIKADGLLHSFENKELADQSQVTFTDTINFDIHFYQAGELVLHVTHHILPNGYLKITQLGKKDNQDFGNTEIYHKQMSVLPYSSSVSGAVIKPTQEGVIKHKALTAMEEQTNMQLDQIRKQIELLAMQAQEIQKRKELSMMIYAAKLSFKPNIGQTYYLYSKQDDSFVLSMVSPKEWGGNGPFKSFEGAVRLLADHTWVEM